MYGGRIREETCNAYVGDGVPTNDPKDYKRCGKPATSWVEDDFIGETCSCCDEHPVTQKLLMTMGA